MVLRTLLLISATAALLTGLASQGLTSKGVPTQHTKGLSVDFNRDVRPVLAQHCWPCHGQDKDALKRTGGVSLDTFAGATADYFGTRPIVPGKPERSAVLARITSSDPDSQMPPRDSGIKPPTPAEIETIKTWIRQGAEYRQHWAFVPPKMPPLPAVRNISWVRNDVDRFVLSRLDEEGLRPEPEADKRTLIRRVSLTLTGLPPTPSEVESFVADPRPDAYDRLVDRLLDSPRYGENQARYWLDAVRYADTHGLHIDNERSIYPYRDWVVRAYNEDVSYNQFVLWQLAGDMLPNPTLDQKIATGYVRLNPTTNEGGAIEAEFLAKNTFDRVDTTATALLGVTLQCAKCHDHKYDPFTQKDYYSMFAYFNSTVDTPLDGNQRLHEPVMPAPTPEQSQRLAILSAEIKEMETRADLPEAREWALNSGSNAPSFSDWQISGPYSAKDFETAYGRNFGPEPAGSADQETLPWRPIPFDLDNLHSGLIGKENAAIYLRSEVTVPAATQIDLRLGSDDAIKVWLNGVSVHENFVQRALAPNQDTIGVTLRAGENRLLIKIVNAAGEDGAYVGLGGAMSQKLARSRELAQLQSPTSDQQAELVRNYLTLGPATPLARRYRETKHYFDVEQSEIPMTYVAKELPMPRPAFLLRRGQYDLPGDPVSRAIPKVFGAIADTKHNNRLGLAEWIIDPKNPLTARVIVNRIWQQHFGQGLVKSSEDFGSRGDWPSHPELLDYLACRFVKDGWSVKKLTRMILTSATFRQAATAAAAKRVKDPDNTLLSRGPRFRLDAEVIRDSALYVSGLLVEKPGGHADKSYQPPGLWEIIAYPISDTAHYVQDHGDALYRRSLYLFWKRTSPPPAMLLFDAPMRESCVVRRSRTNTPTQALASLNETGFFEDARAMAQRLLKSKATDLTRIDYAFELATGRPPSKDEAQIVEDFLNQARSTYRANPADAKKTLAIGESPRDGNLPPAEHAAWTLVCNMVLNLDETLTQH